MGGFRSVGVSHQVEKTLSRSSNKYLVCAKTTSITIPSAIIINTHQQLHQVLSKIINHDTKCKILGEHVQHGYKKLCFARLRVIAVLGCVTNRASRFRFLAEHVLIVHSRMIQGSGLFAGIQNNIDIASMSCETKITANETTTQTNPAQSNSTHPTKRNMSPPSFANRINLFYFQYEMIMFSTTILFVFLGPSFDIAGGSCPSRHVV